ncbi:MAG: M48 family metallopeptidase [Elusimicrobia bacterium]|nr:M48 family metallopeptidase [Elusimicrobiota bacterium]
MPFILYRRQRIEFKVLVTQRSKTMALKVHRNGVAEVRAPKFMTRAQVRQFVSRRSSWIVERQCYFRELKRRHPGKELKNGESFSVLGRNLRLKLERRQGLEVPYCQVEDRRLKVVVDGQEGDALRAAMSSAVRSWYSALTERKASAVVRKHARALAVKPGKLRIGDQAMRWASCSKSGDIRLNWRLSMMPIPVLEYVIVHELCHLKTHDHSARFWRILKSVLPDFERRRQWLRREGPGVAIF